MGLEAKPDTSVLAELRKPRPHPAVIAWYEGVADEELFLSVLLVGEIKQGVTRLRRKDPRQAAAYEVWLGKLRREFASRVLPVSQDVALEWGRLSAGNPPPIIDGLMAATAVVHGLTVVTRNVADFEPTGVALLNPFED